MNGVDLLIVIFLLFGLRKGYRRGFLNSVVGLVSVFFGLLVAWQVHFRVADYLEQQWHLLTKIAAKLAQYFVFTETQFSVNEQQFWDYLGVLVQKVGGPVSEAALDVGSEFFYLWLAQLIFYGMVFVLLWFLVSQGLVLLSCFITRLMEETIWGSLNQIGGLCLGLLSRLLILCVLCGLLKPFLQMASFAQTAFLSLILEKMSTSFFVPGLVLLYSYSVAKILAFLF